VWRAINKKPHECGETKNPAAAGEVITQKFDFEVIL